MWGRRGAVLEAQNVTNPGLPDAGRQPIRSGADKVLTCSLRQFSCDTRGFGASTFGAAGYEFAVGHTLQSSISRAVEQGLPYIVEALARGAGRR